MTHIALESLNIAGILLLGAGFLWKDRRAHLLRSVGWTLEGIYWFSRTSEYFSGDDQFNALGTIMALPIFCFLAYHEFNSYKWNDDYPPLRFVAGAMFIAGAGYILVQHVPAFSNFIIELVAHQSVWLANLGGYEFSVGSMGYEGVSLVGVPIMIVLECTAIQAYFIAGAFLFGCRGDPKIRGIIFLIMVPTIWVVNLFRNAMVIILVHNQGVDIFDFAHNILGKGLSVVALVLLIIVAFINVPELYEDINGLFELPWRRGPKHDYLRFVGRLYREDETA
ncbi:MAG: archaeosortase A [Candidatus Thermoplasmatota archaeon]|nr:archaeosortase A [Euryarchaeota archaeon]MBU4032338.1 archaeosortase A [Candidatus Thermoplasmatota archaeon]MBU4071741.1 archaeosortase A [Candidatus Thermoplasmatota archaeon]MBU4144835.1 archaeosortase A [Candidatus Thermoplasmatota archaeon]MBU4592148.1 archaeosortase A [Candidatus Thermoplasmatota archaeon]